MILSLRKLLALFKSIWNPVTKENNRLIFFHAAVQALGKDIVPDSVVEDELACAAVVNAIHEKAFGFPIGGTTSTYRMYEALKDNPFFKRVSEPLEGDIIISPTGYGNLNIMTGHVGIVGERSKVMNNSSRTGKFVEFYTLDSWKKRWVERGGYPVYYYRRV